MITNNNSPPEPVIDDIATQESQMPQLSPTPSSSNRWEFLIGVNDPTDPYTNELPHEPSPTKQAIPLPPQYELPPIPTPPNLPSVESEVPSPMDEGLYIPDECIVLPFWREQIICDGELLVEIPYSTENNSPIVMNQPDSQLIESSDTSAVVSYIVDIHLEFPGDTMTGEVEICIRPDDLGVDQDEVCLGFLDTNVAPPEWACEAVCLEKKGDLLCGKTDHFTNFALLLGMASNAAKEDCNPLDIYVMGSIENDLILITSCVAVMCFFGFCCFFIVFNVTPVTKFVYGKEGYRIKRLRWNSTRSFIHNDVLPNSGSIGSRDSWSGQADFTPVIL